jgi:hypothetical protein
MRIFVRRAIEADLPRISELDDAIARLRNAGHRQGFLTTGQDTRAAAFYHARGWRQTGIDMRGEAVFRLWL